MNISDEALATHLSLQGLTLAKEWVEHVRGWRARKRHATTKWHLAVCHTFHKDPSTYWSRTISARIKYENMQDQCTLANGEVYTYDMVPE